MLGVLDDSAHSGESSTCFGKAEALSGAFSQAPFELLYHKHNFSIYPHSFDDFTWLLSFKKNFILKTVNNALPLAWTSPCTLNHIAHLISTFG